LLACSIENNRAELDEIPTQTKKKIAFHAIMYITSVLTRERGFQRRQEAVMLVNRNQIELRSKNTWSQTVHAPRHGTGGGIEGKLKFISEIPVLDQNCALADRKAESRQKEVQITKCQ
jgi:hypothetical protein